MKVSYPIIIINFKTYLQATGKRALEIARTAEKVSNEVGVCIAVAPQFTDITTLSSSFDIPVFAQHVDPYPPGAHTGRITSLAIKEAGAAGSLVNHSERRLSLDDIGTVIKSLKDLNLISILCAGDVDACAAGVAFSPTMVAIEPPELIGTGISVSKAKPEIVRMAVDAVKGLGKSIHVICGAGISTGEDVKKAIELGTEGILVASSLVLAKDLGSLLNDMAEQALKIFNRI